MKMKRIEISKRVLAALVGALSIGAAGTAVAQRSFAAPRFAPPAPFMPAAARPFAAPPGMAMPFNPGAVPNPAATFNPSNPLNRFVAAPAAATGVLPFNPGVVPNPAMLVNPSNPIANNIPPGAVAGAAGSANGAMAGQSVTTSAPQVGFNGDMMAAATVTASGETAIIGPFRWASNHIIDFTNGTIGNGTFTVTDSRGNELFGTYTGGFDGVGDFQLNYIMTGGAGAFARASGSGTITGVSSGTQFEATVV